MTFHVLDEVLDLGEYGAALIVPPQEEITALQPGMVLRDARKNHHVLSEIQKEEDYTILCFRDSSPAALGRLMRDLFVDATAFEILEDAP